MKKILTITIIFLTMFISIPVNAENVCYQCNSHSNVYKWGSNSDADSSCPGGYHKLSLSEMECLGKGASYKTVSCAGFDDIPAALPKFISNIINLIKIVTPIILIIMGMTDFLRSTIANDEKGMNEGKNRFIKRTIAGVIVFLVISIVQLVFGAIGTESSRTVAACINCFVNGTCGSSSSELYPDFTCSDLSQDKCWGFDSNGDVCTWSEEKCIRVKDKPDTSGCREYNKENCDGLHLNKLCKWDEEENWCSYGGIPQDCSSYNTTGTCDGKNDDFGNVCAWIDGKCTVNNKTNCSDYDSKDTCPPYISGDSNGENKVCNWLNDKCTEIKYSVCSNYLTDGSCPSMINGTLCKWNKDLKSCIQVGTAENCSKWSSQDDCETFTDDYGNACYWDNGCKNVTEYECSDYTSLGRAECNAATDSDGNKCLWNVSSGCEIDDPNALG